MTKSVPTITDRAHYGSPLKQTTNIQKEDIPYYTKTSEAIFEPPHSPAPIPNIHSILSTSLLSPPLEDVHDTSGSSDNERACPGEAAENVEGGQEWIDSQSDADESEEEQKEAAGKSSGGGMSWEEREAPTVEETIAALGDLTSILRPKWQNAKGYKDPKIDVWMRGRLGEMQTFMNHYTGAQSKTRGKWTASALETVVGVGKKPGHSRALRSWTKAYIRDREDIPRNPYGTWSTSRLDEDDLTLELQIHLRTVGKYVAASDLVQYLDRPEVKQRLKMPKTISLATAKRWMGKLGYVWVKNHRGQYVDGHERDDVVAYRKEVFLPTWFRAEARMRSWSGDEMEVEEIRLPGSGRILVAWLHDESIYYANDRRKSHWKDPNDCAKPEAKGEGASLMVSDYVSADFGWLHSPPGVEPAESARILMKPGKTRDGYQTNEDIIAQAEIAMDILTKHYSQYDHLLIYDNATIHTKRPANAPSATNTPKNIPSGAKNWGPKVPARGLDGKVLMDGEKVRQTTIRMEGGSHEGTPQSFYFPDDHPQHPGKFKGMAVILEERGYGNMSKVRYECKGFKCDPDNDRCCCRRMLYKQPDFANVKTNLEIACARRGFPVLFLPKFHCEINFIEQCWCHAKRTYRLNPPSSSEADLKRNLLSSLDSVDLTHMRRSAENLFNL